jgi:hypothetical protein
MILTGYALSRLCYRSKYVEALRSCDRNTDKAEKKAILTMALHNESCRGNKSSMSDSAMQDDSDSECRGASELRERTAVKVDA